MLSCYASRPIHLDQVISVSERRSFSRSITSFPGRFYHSLGMKHGTCHRLILDATSSTPTHVTVFSAACNSPADPRKPMVLHGDLVLQQVPHMRPRTSSLHPTAAVLRQPSYVYKSTSLVLPEEEIPLTIKRPTWSSK